MGFLSHEEIIIGKRCALTSVRRCSPLISAIEVKNLCKHYMCPMQIMLDISDLLELSCK